MSRHDHAEDILVGVVADDLTSAADGVAPFAAHGLDVHMGLCAVVPSDGTVRSVDTGSRGVAAPKARRRVHEAARALARARILYKTVDSTLRGHVAVEIDAARQSGGRACVILAPAFPAAGRITRDGRQHVDGVPLGETRYARDPVHAAPEGDLAALLGGGTIVLARGEAPPAPGDADILIADAETQSDLDRLVQGVSDPESCLWVGSPGLAAALASRFAPSTTTSCERAVAPPVRRVLVAAGSANAATRVQVDTLAARGVPVLAAGEAPPRGPVVVAYATPRDRQPDSHALLARFAGHVAAALGEGAFDALVVTGGDTAERVARACGFAELEVLGELAPGFAATRARTPFALSIAMKAGGFGGPDTLAEAAGALLARDEAIA